LELIFLGSGGGRWVTLYQRVKTGGFRIHGSSRVQVDPGPGALVSMHNMRLNPIGTDAVIVTHSHPDHYNDAEIIVEAMTKGMTVEKGVLAGSRSVLLGSDSLGPAISKYHQSRVRELHVLAPGKRFTIGGMEVEALPTRHTDPGCVGLRFQTEEGVITYTADTEYFEGIEEHYMGSRVLILNVLRPGRDRIPRHFCTEDAIKILDEVKPELAILNHFGMKMVSPAASEAKRVEKETGVKTIPARDESRVNISGEQKQKVLDRFER